MLVARRSGIFSPGWLLLGLLAVSGGSLYSQPNVYSLSDNNSSAQINVNGVEGDSGMFNWYVDGQSFLNRQWFWYRSGTSDPERQINTISAASVGEPYGPGGRGLTTTYTSAANYSVRIDYLLSGGNPGSGVSDISETITINNLSAATLDFHFFQYSDFDLSIGQDTVQLGKNLRGKFNEASQFGPGGALTETVITPGADRGEAASYDSTLVKLDDGVANDLSNVTIAGPTDATWAFQWNLTIAPGGSAIISKDKYLNVSSIPEPSIVSVLSVGLVAWAVYRRRYWGKSICGVR